MAEVKTDAQRFRDALEKLDMTQRGFAAEIGLGERHIRKLCAGDEPVPRYVWMVIELLTIKRRRK